jgi:hypothetical protein
MDDPRRKLHPDQHQEIRKLHEEGQSQRSLARQYGCSRSLIGIIVNPERAAAVSERIKENWKQYVNREDLTSAALATRARKRKMGLAFPVKK